MCRLVEESQDPCSVVAPIVLIVVLPGVAKREQASSLLVSASSVSASESFPSPSFLSLHDIPISQGFIK